jgi:hypothetical protein
MQSAGKHSVRAWVFFRRPGMLSALEALVNITPYWRGGNRHFPGPRCAKNDLIVKKVLCFQQFF